MPAQPRLRLRRRTRDDTARGDATADRQNFAKMLLVFGGIGTDLCKKIRVFQQFLEIYMILLAEILKIWQNFTFATFAKILFSVDFCSC